MNGLVAMVGLIGCGGDGVATTPGMDPVPMPGGTGGGVCVPEGLWHSSVFVELCCEDGDGGNDDVCQGNVASTNPQIGVTTRDVGGIQIPENTCQNVALDTTAFGVGQQADLIVRDLDCAIDRGCPTGFLTWNCPQCEFSPGRLQVCN